jgi:hypothetical protein
LNDTVVELKLDDHSQASETFDGSYTCQTNCSSC